MERNIDVIKDADGNSIVMIQDLPCQYMAVMGKWRDTMFSKLLW